MSLVLTALVMHGGDLVISIASRNDPQKCHHRSFESSLRTTYDLQNQEDGSRSLIQRTSQIRDPMVFNRNKGSKATRDKIWSEQVVTATGIHTATYDSGASHRELPVLVSLPSLPSHPSLHPSLSPSLRPFPSVAPSSAHSAPSSLPGSIPSLTSMQLGIFSTLHRGPQANNFTTIFESQLNPAGSRDTAIHLTNVTQQASNEHTVLAFLVALYTKEIGGGSLIFVVTGLFVIFCIIGIVLKFGSALLTSPRTILEYASPHPTRPPPPSYQQGSGVHIPRLAENLENLDKDKELSGVLKAVKLDTTKTQRTTGFSRHCLNVANEGGIDEFYEIQGCELGRGSFGSVHEATHKASGTVRAVKTIAKSSLADTSVLAQEIEIIQWLDHPNIVRLYEVFEDARCIYIVMELCTGGELFDAILNADSGFSEKSAARLIKQVAGAVFYMHSMGIAHRDLKPENFLLAADVSVDDCTLKLIDFGSAHRTKPDTPMTTKTYTPYYVAPEVLKGSYGVPCDVWSLGVLLYVLLCGRPPFGGDTDEEILRSVKRGTFDFNKPAWMAISDDAKDLIRKVLVSHPEERYTAEQVLRHPWVDKLAPKASSAALSAAAFGNLRGFHAQGKFKKAALTAMAKHLGDSAIQDLKEMFFALDADGNGTITIEELQDGIKKMGMEVPENLMKIMSDVDSDGSGEIDYSEFLAATLDRRHYMCEDVCWAAFRTFDLDGNGQITKEELLEVLTGNASENIEEMLGMQREEIEQIIRDADVDGDGEIDFEEFVLMMSGGKESRTPSLRSFTKYSSGASAGGASVDWRSSDESLGESRDQSRRIRFSDPEVTDVISGSGNLEKALQQSSDSKQIAH